MPVRAGEHVVVLGVGALGLLWTRVLSVTGASVTAVDPNPERRELARALGAETVEDSGAFEERVAAGAVGADLVVEAVGAEQAWEIAVRAAPPEAASCSSAARPAGTSITLDTQRMHYDELTLIASFHHTPYHFAEALRALAAGLLDVEPDRPGGGPAGRPPGLLPAGLRGRRAPEGRRPPRGASLPGVGGSAPLASQLPAPDDGLEEQVDHREGEELPEEALRDALRRPRSGGRRRRRRIRSSRRPGGSRTSRASPSWRFLSGWGRSS